MTYSQKFGNYGIYTDDMLYKWFKDLNKALDYWNEMTEDAEAVEEWLEEYDTIKLVNMKTKEVIKHFSID